MTEIEPFTLLAGGILLLLALLTPMMSVFFRKPRIAEPNRDGREQVRFSIIIPAHDNAAELSRNLPHLLTLPYDAGYEVIVVDESSTDNTDAVLTQLKSQYPNLYTTYVPASTHYVSRRKLAITIGMKAAKNEWVILTEPSCYPEHEDWLDCMASHCVDEADVVCGYTGYEAGSKSYYIFERMLMNCHLLRHPYRYEGANLAIRKTAFMARNGFLKNLMCLRGEYDFLVNESQCASIMTTPRGRMRQEQPTRKAWNHHHLYLMDTRPHLQQTRFPRFLFNLDQLVLYLNYLLQLAVLAFSLTRHHWPLAVASGSGLLLSLVLRTIFARRAATAFGEAIATWKLPFLELLTIWHGGWFLLKYHLADKYSYSRK